MKIGQIITIKGFAKYHGLNKGDQCVVLYYKGHPLWNHNFSPRWDVAVESKKGKKYLCYEEDCISLEDYVEEALKI